MSKKLPLNQVGPETYDVLLKRVEDYQAQPLSGYVKIRAKGTLRASEIHTYPDLFVILLKPKYPQAVLYINGEYEEYYLDQFVMRIPRDICYKKEYYYTAEYEKEEYVIDQEAIQDYIYREIPRQTNYTKEDMANCNLVFGSLK
jgi:hypothetical protein